LLYRTVLPAFASTERVQRRSARYLTLLCLYNEHYDKTQSALFLQRLLDQGVLYSLFDKVYCTTEGFLRFILYQTVGRELLTFSVTSPPSSSLAFAVPSRTPQDPLRRKGSAGIACSTQNSDRSWEAAEPV